MSAYLWLKLVHVAAAIIAVGANVTYFFWLARINDAPGSDAFVLDGLAAIDRRLANPAYAVLPVTGVAMVLVGDLGFTTFWIATAIGLYVVMGAFAGILFAPSLRRQLAIARDGGRDQSDYGRAARRTALTGSVTMALIVAIVVLMVVKPA